MKSIILYIIILLLPTGVSAFTDEEYTTRMMSIAKENDSSTKFELIEDILIESNDDERFSILTKAAKIAFETKNYDAARNYAEELLETSKTNKNNWNYGNAVHDRNMVLGLLAINLGNINLVAEYLIKAGETPGSPQLDSFGPDLDLANELLKIGKKDEVLTYLNSIKKFWDMDGGLIDKWINEINNGKKPELNRHAYNDVSWIIIISWLSTLWPIIIILLFLAKLRKKIKKKVLFCISGSIVGYATMLMLNWASTLLITSIVSKSIETVETNTLMLQVFAITGSVFLLPVIAIFFISRLFTTSSE